MDNTSVRDGTGIRSLYNASLDSSAEMAQRQARNIIGFAKVPGLCKNSVPSRANLRSGSPVVGSKPRCTDHAAISSGQGIRLLVGVHSAPSGRIRRDAIRTSWMQWPSPTVLICFLLGREGLPPIERQRLRAEAEQFNDLLFIDGVADECVLSIPKSYGWWKLASTMLPPAGSTGIAHVAKVDDDSFLHVPNVVADLASLHCVPALGYGVLGFVGYRPTDFTKCGFAFVPFAKNWKKYGCPLRGYHQPHPFFTGAVQILSAPVVRELAQHAGVAAFVQRARALDLTEWDNGEDVALGFWLSRLSVNITYVSVGRAFPNLGCLKNQGLYRHPTNGSRGLHFVKKPQGMAYLWETLAGRRPHNRKRCNRMAGVG